jgi:hypothetical protein
MARLRLQVIVNGRLRCIAGIDEPGDTSALIAYSFFPPPETPWGELFPAAESEEPDRCELRVSADPLHGEYESLEWLQELLRPGDEVTIRVLGPGEADPPVKSLKREPPF